MSDVVLTFGEITSFRPNLNTTLLFDISPHYFEQRPENNLVTNEQSKGDSNSQTRDKEGTNTSSSNQDLFLQRLIFPLQTLGFITLNRTKKVLISQVNEKNP